MPPERFEMRIDSELLERLDNWRNIKGDTPSRAEAVRRLIEAGLANENEGRPPQFTDGEKLIALMVGDLIKGLKVETDMNISLVEKAIYGGHNWALGWEMPGIFHGHADSLSDVRFVVDVLDMWTFLEEAYETLRDVDNQRLVAEVGPIGENIAFSGFDGNKESEYLSIVRFLVEDLGRFGRFKSRSLDSHSPTIGRYARMFDAFEPIRAKLIGRRMNIDELIEVLKARASA